MDCARPRSDVRGQVVFLDTIRAIVDSSFTAGLLNAAAGNAVELVVAVQALLDDNFRIVQTSLLGGIFSNLLLVAGACFFCGDLRHAEQVMAVVACLCR